MNQNEYNKLQERIAILEEERDIYKCAFNMLFIDAAKGKFGCKIDGVGLHNFLYLNKAKEVICDKIPYDNSNEYNISLKEHEKIMREIESMRYTIANQKNDYMSLSYELHELEKENKRLKEENIILKTHCNYYKKLSKELEKI